ncbi:WD40-repeat-containing domain protein [Flagelloscypha sp. PMI_526]|nr:WD40-repeat-containing domain protein [Flagelloscypha sp. PMI_526]
MASQPAVFSTQTRYVLPSTKFMIPTEWKRFQLSQLVNKALSLPKPTPFDFLVRGQLLGARSLGEWCLENGVGEEETLEIEYIESVLPPQKVSDFEHDDWVSSVSSQSAGHFITGSYDGHLRLFNYSRHKVLDYPLFSSALSSLSIVGPVKDSGSFTLAAASLDMTAKLSTIEPPSDSEELSLSTTASLHLHTGPISSVTSNTVGSHLLTASWDSLIGLWDSTIPDQDEVADQTVNRATNKRRKLNSSKDEGSAPKKAPIAVLKSHTARVSRAIFSRDGRRGYSCGFDSSIRIWDTENGLCTQSIMAAEQPFLDIVATLDQTTLVGASTNRIVSAYDIRTPSEANATNSISLLHPATPSCLVSAPSSNFKILSGSYDGVARIWDLRNTKGTVASFKVWDKMKILSVDWKGDMVLVGGEGGMEVWKIPEEGSS